MHSSHWSCSWQQVQAMGPGANLEWHGSCLWEAFWKRARTLQVRWAKEGVDYDQAEKTKRRHLDTWKMIQVPLIMISHRLMVRQVGGPPMTWVDLLNRTPPWADLFGFRRFPQCLCFAVGEFVFIFHAFWSNYYISSPKTGNKEFPHHKPSPPVSWWGRYNLTIWLFCVQFLLDNLFIPWLPCVHYRPACCLWTRELPRLVPADLLRQWKGTFIFSLETLFSNKWEVHPIEKKNETS